MPGAVHQLRPSPAEATTRLRKRAKIVFQRERFADIVTDLGALWRRHDLELWPKRNWGRLRPNIVQYLQLEAQSMLHIVTAREGGSRGKIIGYCFELVLMDMHYAETKSSVNDLIYLHPDYRIAPKGDGLSLRRHPAMRLMREREKLLDDLKVTRRRIDFKAWRNFGPALKALGYEIEAVRYQKIATGAEDEE